MEVSNETGLGNDVLKLEAEAQEVGRSGKCAVIRNTRD
jgi:hypothetical protein